MLLKKIKSIAKRLVLILVTAAMISLPAFPAAAAPATTIVTVPAGDTTVSIDLLIYQDAPYAGIEFTLDIDDGNALKFTSFTPALAGANNAPYSNMNGLHNFGFFTGKNAYGAGLVKVGTMNFDSYTGIQDVKVTIIEMIVTRVDGSNKTSETVTHPFESYTIRRAMPGGGDETPKPDRFTITFDLAGGVWTGGGALEQLVDRGSKPIPPLTTREGYTFDGWDIDVNTFAFSKDATVTAIWKSDTPDVVDPGPGGPGGTDPGPDTGSEIPDGWVPLVPGFPFTDVSSGAWYAEDVLYMWQNNLMNGTSASQFSPNSRVRRGMIVTVLYRMEGEPDVSALENPFTDVADGMYYTEAVIWAAANEIVRGYGNNRFGPNDDVTREQLATMLYRYQEYKGEMAPDVNEARVFADAGKISGYATEPVDTLVKQGIINGKNNNMFDPKGNATRAEYAAMLHRYLLTVDELPDGETEEGEPEEGLPEDGTPEEGQPDEELPEDGLPADTLP